MNQRWYKLSATWRRGIAHHGINVKDRWSKRIGVAIVEQVRHGALASDQIGYAVAIHISELRGMRFRKSYVTSVAGQEVIHDGVLHKSDLAGRIALLLIPRQSVAMPLQSRHHVG